MTEEFTEIESGKRADRPQLAKALTACRVHNATLVIAKLDRLARNVAFIAQLMDSGADFVAVDMSTANRLTVHILAAMAEYEREMISARTKAALAQAKARGVKLGGDRGHLPALARKASKASVATRAVAARRRARDLADVIADLRDKGATTFRALAAGLNERKITAPRGGQWSPMQTRRMLQWTA